MATVTLEQHMDAYKESAFDAQNTYNKVNYGGVLKLEPVPTHYRYMALIKDYTQTIPLDRTYHHKPEFLSDDLYGTDEYWSLLLELNGCTSRADFNKDKVVIIARNEISTVRDIMKLAFTKFKQDTGIVTDLTIKQPGGF